MKGLKQRLLPGTFAFLMAGRQPTQRLFGKAPANSAAQPSDAIRPGRTTSGLGSESRPSRNRECHPLAGLATVLFLGVSSAVAQTDGQWVDASALSRVEVQGESTAPRDQKTLEDLAKASALFNQSHALAPQAELRFRVLARLDRTQSERLSIQVMAPTGRIDVPLDSLSRFRMDPSWLDLPPKTVVRSKLFDGDVAWRSDVRTPGLPPNVRRLGDLRLQCKLDWGTSLARRGPLSNVSLVPGSAVCESRFTGAMNSQFADRPVLAVDLVHGERHERLSYFFLHGAGDNTPTRAISSTLDWWHDLRDHMYRLPLHDTSWPDDTRVEFIFMDMGAMNDAQVTP